MIACGICGDEMLYRAFPFTFYWPVAFMIWSLAIGLPLGIASWISNAPLPVNSFRYFLLAIGLFFSTAILTMGSVAIPLTLASGFSLLGIHKSMRRNKEAPLPSGLPRAAHRIDRIFFLVCLLAIPMSYIRAWLQFRG